MTSLLLLWTNTCKPISWMPVNITFRRASDSRQKTLDDLYPNDLDNSLVDRLCHFATFADIFKDEEPGDIRTELFLYILIIGQGV